ncbi:hypothetical protein C5F56_29415, partial [Escherichia coli]
KQKKLIMLPSETMIWQPEFTDKTLSRKPGAVQSVFTVNGFSFSGQAQNAGVDSICQCRISPFVFSFV